MGGWWRGLTLLLLLVCWVSKSAASTRPSDVVALQGLLRAWRGTPGLSHEWSLDEDADPCGSRWKGVRCCHRNTIVSLDLSNAGLIGSIPVEIGDIHNLRHLDLSGNPMLTAAIPKEIANLRQLTTLKISGCDLSGEIPQELSSLSKLKFLDLSNNPSLSTTQDHSQRSTEFSDSSSRVIIQQKSAPNSRRFLRHRALLQTAPVTAPPAGTTPPAGAAPPAGNTPPVGAISPVVQPPAPASAPAPPPFIPPSPPTPVRSYLLWIGIAAFCLVFISIATFCLCRKFGQQKIRGAQRLPPLPRYH